MRLSGFERTHNWDFMNKVAFSAFALLLAGCQGSFASPAPDGGPEEFVGPFASWMNVQTRFGATGNGVTDDTRALQDAINNLSPTSPTVYLPSGSYCISRSLTLAGKPYVRVLGADPATTSIVWCGPAGGTMLYVNGMSYSTVGRIAFNGQNRAAIAIDQSWDGSTGSFDTENQYPDVVLENVGVGFRCGALGAGCAETVMLRPKYLNNSVAGVSMGNFNALDMFIWYAMFSNNTVGVTNTSGAGNFHVFRSVFQNSSIADIQFRNTGLFNFRYNYSSGSNEFIRSGASANPCNVTVEDNVILDTTNPTSIKIGCLGPLVMIDNTVRSLAGARGSAVYAANWNPTDLFSMGNTFTVPSPEHANGHFHSVQDQVVGRSSVNPTMPTLPGTPPNNNRRIFEVKPGATAVQIQHAINQAAASGTTRPVVHIQPGTFDVASTLSVPANSDVQIIGDGYYSQLTWAGTGTGPVMQLSGPSMATLRNFSVNGNGNGNGIFASGIDQPGARVFMEEVNFSGSSTNLSISGLTHASIEIHDFFHEGAGTHTSVVVTGPSGCWLGSAVNVYAGASSGNNISWALSKAAHVAVRDVWYDNGAGGSQLATVTGPSIFTYAGSLVAETGKAPVFEFNNFTGTAALINSHLSGNVAITGSDSGASVLGLGLVGPGSFFSNASSPAATTGFLNGQSNLNPPWGERASELPDQGNANPTFLTNSLNQIRTTPPTVPGNPTIPAGVTDLRIYRVFVNDAVTGVQITP
jgi:Pectate lyase superfamily protein